MRAGPIGAFFSNDPTRVAEEAVSQRISSRMCSGIFHLVRSGKVLRRRAAYSIRPAARSRPATHSRPPPIALDLLSCSQWALNRAIRGYNSVIFIRANPRPSVVTTTSFFLGGTRPGRILQHKRDNRLQTRWLGRAQIPHQLLKRPVKERT